jgi:hypothetical protein
MRIRRLLRAPEAAFTWYERNSREQLFELLLGRAVFARLYADTARGRDMTPDNVDRHRFEVRPQRSHITAIEEA